MWLVNSNDLSVANIDPDYLSLEKTQYVHRRFHIYSKIHDFSPHKVPWKQNIERHGCLVTETSLATFKYYCVALSFFTHMLNL